MAVVSVVKAWTRQAAAITPGFAEWVTGYDVLLDDATQGAYYASIAVDPVTGVKVPSIGVKVEPDNAIVMGIFPQVLGPFHFMVEVRSLRPPTTDPPEIVTRYVRRQEYVDIDIDGKPALNSSLETFDPPLVDDEEDLQIIVTQYINTFPHTLLLELKKTVNSEMIWGYAPGTVKLDDLERLVINIGDPIVTPSGPLPGGNPPTVKYPTTYYRRTLVFLARKIPPYLQKNPEKTWWKRRVDAGYREFIGSYFELPDPENPVPNPLNGMPLFREILDDTGRALTSPVLLNGGGYRNPADAPPAYIYIKRVSPFNFNTLGLPRTI